MSEAEESKDNSIKQPRAHGIEKITCRTTVSHDGMSGMGVKRHKGEGDEVTNKSPIPLGQHNLSHKMSGKTCKVSDQQLSGKNPPSRKQEATHMALIKGRQQPS